MSSGARRHFSREEAEALLPEIDALLRRALDLLTELQQAQRGQGAREQANDSVHRNGKVVPPSPGAHAAQDRLAEIVGRIQAQGVIVRDIRSGLIDFPALRNDVEVFLCWQRGEPLRIEWWHPTSTGIAGRQRL